MNAAEQRQIVRERELAKASIPLTVLDIEDVAERTRVAVEAMRAAGRDDEQIYTAMYNDYFCDTYLFGRNLNDDEIDEQQDVLDEMGIE